MSIYALIENQKSRVAGIRLGLGFPCNYDHVPRAFFQSMMMMVKPDYEFILAETGSVETMRNHIVRAAIEAKCTHLMMMDTDMLYHPDTIFRLLSHRAPVVGALCYRRYPPFDPLMFRGKPGSYKSIDEWNTDVVEVDATGTGCLMFEMEVFKRTPAPWFNVRYTEDGKPIGEDIGFCATLRDAGYRIFVDTTIPAGHLSQMEITDATYRLYKAMKIKQARAAMA